MAITAPTGGTVITSGFRTKKRPDHNGIDFRTRTLKHPNGIGTPIYAVEGGIVRNYWGTNGGGRVTEVTHKDGSRAYYSHQSKYALNTGDHVTPGQVLGYSGNTGNTTGAHLHLALMNSRGAWIDPTPWINRNNAEAAREEAARKAAAAKAEAAKKAAAKRKAAAVQAVKAFQTALKALGLYGGRIDGIPGDKTDAGYAALKKLTK